MAIGGGMSCVKYLLFFFNLLFAITGLIIFIAGIKSEIKALPYTDFTNSSFYTSAPIVLILVGVIVFIVAFFGCCGAVKENHCMIITFSVFLLIIFVAELAVGLAGYIKHQDIENSAMEGLNKTMKEYPTDKEIARSWDILQTDLHCCGINSPKDWANNGIPLPSTCCTGQEISGGQPAPCTEQSENFHINGCLPELITHYKDIAIVLGGVGIGVAIVQLLGVIFACCLARSIRSQYETV